MNTSESIKQVAAAFLAAQKEMGNAIKGSVNPFLKNKYADLNSVREAVIPALNQHGISVIQPHVIMDGRNYVETILLHESGEFISGLTEIVFADKNNAQAQGSGITYARRYGLQSICNIGADDDDGNTATAPSKALDSELPWLTDAQFSKALERIKKGENLLPDLLTSFRIKRAFREELEAAKTK
jgi:hypothetical protein